VVSWDNSNSVKILKEKCPVAVSCIIFYSYTEEGKGVANSA